jgi:hypothetical protein
VKNLNASLGYFGRLTAGSSRIIFALTTMTHDLRTDVRSYPVVPAASSRCGTKRSLRLVAGQAVCQCSHFGLVRLSARFGIFGLSRIAAG